MNNQLKFDLLDYLSSRFQKNNHSNYEVPSLKELSHQQGVSIAKLREQLSVARSYGFVDVQPKTGIKMLPYSFAPAVKNSLSFALSLDRSYFDDFSDLRKFVEANFWFEAVSKVICRPGMGKIRKFPPAFTSPRASRSPSKNLRQN